MMFLLGGNSGLPRRYGLLYYIYFQATVITRSLLFLHCCVIWSTYVDLYYVGGNIQLTLMILLGAKTLVF